MIKAQDFLHYLCNVLEYRSFAGYPNEGFIPLYNYMDSGFMHYTPTVRSDIAFNLALGTALGGVKSVVIADTSSFNENYGLLKNTVFAHKVPFLILLYNDIGVKKLPIKMFRLTDNYESVLKRASSFALKNKTQCVVLIEEGVLE